MAIKQIHIVYKLTHTRTPHTILIILQRNTSCGNVKMSTWQMGTFSSCHLSLHILWWLLKWGSCGVYWQYHRFVPYCMQTAIIPGNFWPHHWFPCILLTSSWLRDTVSQKLSSLIVPDYISVTRPTQMWNKNTKYTPQLLISKSANLVLGCFVLCMFLFSL